MARVFACVALFVAVLSIPAAFAAARMERTAHASVGGQSIRVGGRAFFPIMLIDQCDAGAAARAHKLGVNLILNESCAGVTSRRQLTQAARAALSVLPMRGRAVQGKSLVGFAYPDEPDNNGWTPASLRRRFAFRPGSPDGLLSFMTTSGRFFSGVDRNASVPLSEFGQFTRLSDVSGFDLYPLNHCTQDLAVVADAQRQFVTLAGGRPTFQWIETGPIEPSYCGGFQMTPVQLSAETWLAIVGGARGIGFFTHTWSPSHDSFDVAPDLQLQIAQMTAAMRALLPGLTGKTIPSISNSGAIHVLARAGTDGRTYVIAVNATNGPVVARVTVPSLGTRPLARFADPRPARAIQGKIDDTFPPLGIRIYVAARGGV